MQYTTYLKVDESHLLIVHIYLAFLDIRGDRSYAYCNINTANWISINYRGTSKRK